MGIIEALIEFQRTHGYCPSMEELGELMNRDKATISPLVGRLVRDGLVSAERLDSDIAAARTMRIKPTNVEPLSPGLQVGKVKQPGTEYLWIGPRGLLLTPEEQIGLMHYLVEKWGAREWIPGNPVLTKEQADKIRAGFEGDPDALRREIIGDWPNAKQEL